MNYAARLQRGERGKIRIKGRYFETAPAAAGEVRVTWSSRTKNTAKWDPLDFWIVPADKVDDAIAKVRAGFEL